MDTLEYAGAYDHIVLPLLSLPALAAILLIILPSAALLGHLAGTASRKRLIAQGREVDTQIGQTTDGAFLAILGLLIAFSYGNALSVTAHSKTALINEAAAIGTAFARTDYIPEPGRTELKQALLAYAETRLITNENQLNTQEDARNFLETTLAAQSKLWPLTIEHVVPPVPPAIQTFIAGSINEVLDAHLLRTRALSEPISIVSQIMVMFATLAALFLLGHRRGALGRPLTWRIFALCAFLFAVLFTISDTGRNEAGLIQVDNTALLATISDMRKALGT